MKIVINEVKTGHSFQRELDKAKETQLIGKKIGDKIEGELVGLEGYTLQITGGSDKDGFPMRRDIRGQRRTFAYIQSGAGVRKAKKGEKPKKMVTGSTVNQSTMQLNTKVVQEGTKKLEELGFVFTPKSKEEREKAKAEKAASRGAKKRK